MARGRSPNRDKAFEIYKDRDGNITNREIADMLDENEKTISNWKCRDKWNVVLQKNECSTTNKKVQKNTDNNIKKAPIAEEVKEVLENTELTDKQRLFCIYYIEDFNATKAYQKANNCSYYTAKSHGYKLLQNVAVKNEIDKLTEECLKEQEISSKLLNKRLVETYIKIAFSDISDYLKFGQKHEKVWKVNDEGEYIPVIDPETGQQKVRIFNVVSLNESAEVDTSIISEVSEGKDGIKIKLQDKMKAMQWLSDRVSSLPIATREKLELEKTKLELAKIKAGENDSDEEFEDDGFMDAIKESVNEVVWTDEEIN